MNNEAILKVLNSIDELREAVFTEVIPEQIGQHFRTSRKEFLLGVRSALDHFIERTDEHAIPNTQEDKHSKHGSHSIEITE